MIAPSSVFSSSSPSAASLVLGASSTDPWKTSADEIGEIDAWCPGLANDDCDLGHGDIQRSRRPAGICGAWNRMDRLRDKLNDKGVEEASQPCRGSSSQ